MEFIFSIFVLIFSIVLHEVSHGLVADRLGDPTARYAGRLTLNPVHHLDPIGSILIPGFLILLRAPILIGWAKPVPYNPLNLRNPQRDSVLVALAGPVSNLLLVALFLVMLKMTAAGILPSNLAAFWKTVIYLNLVLALFNLIPIPPLDGSKILYLFLPSHVQYQLEMYGLLLVLLFLSLFSGPFHLLVNSIFQYLVSL